MSIARAHRHVPVPYQLSTSRAAVSRVKPPPLSLQHQHKNRAAAVTDASTVQGLPEFLDSLKYDDKGLVTVVVQNVDSGDLAMLAYADQAAITETLQTGLATFYSRSRQQRWCKGETSGWWLTELKPGLQVLSIHYDCDRDAIVYLSEPKGPSCHTGSDTCWYQAVSIEDNKVKTTGGELLPDSVPRTALLQLQDTIQQRKQQAANLGEGEKPSWTAKLLADEKLLCKKIREEAGELCETIEKGEGRERTVSEAADLLYHSMVLLVREGVGLEEVAKELRKRFGTSGIAEKASRTKQS